MPQISVTLENAGRLSIGLDDRSIITDMSENYGRVLMSLRNEATPGETMHYLGDYSLMSNKVVIPFGRAISVAED